MTHRKFGPSARFVRSLAAASALVVVVGCSSEVSRFDQAFSGPLVTNSVQTKNQHAVIHGSSTPKQAYPSSAKAGRPLQTFESSAPAKLPAPTTSAAIRPSDLPPVTETQPVATLGNAPQPPVVLQPRAQQAAPLRVLDQMTTASVVAPTASKGGWSAAGGSRVTLRQGETLYNLARRYGVPVKVLVAVNGLSSAEAAVAGQPVTIPTYTHGAAAPVSAPDSDASTRMARSSQGFEGQATGALTVPKHRNGTANAAAPVPQPTSQTPAFHTVTAGQTLYIVSKKYNVRLAALRELNGLTDDNIRIGQRLAIPGGTANTAANGIDPTTTASVPKSNPVRKAVASDAPGQTVANASNTAAASGAFRWPASGKLVEGFGAKTATGINDGIDIAVPVGSNIRAARAGTVIYSGSELQDLGTLVLLSHPGGYVTAYAHASSVLVKRGQKVTSGQVIAKSGSSGNATQPKLHFEIRKNSTPVNPLNYLPN